MRPVYCLLTVAVLAAPALADPPRAVFPGAAWERRQPAALGLDAARLGALQQLVGGRGVVIRHGYLADSWGEISRSEDLASAAKPVISTLLLLAVHEGKLKSVDDPVARFEPRLKDLAGGKDAAITWRHLASQTSGYGLAEKPGAAWAYNDFALALYYQTLTRGVFRDSGTNLLKARLATPLHFQDPHSFDALGEGRPGRLALSVRDFARFGLLYRHAGKWGERRILPADLVRLALENPVPDDLPRTAGQDAPMIAGQKSMGGGKNITAIGPGIYSFNWWLNRPDGKGRRLFAALPPDAFMASGHGGEKMLVVVPCWDLIMCWHTSKINDQDASADHADTNCNRAMRLLAAAVTP